MALKHALPGEVVHLGTDHPDAPAKTAALVKSDRFEAVRLIVPQGASIAPHRVDGYLTLLCIEGRVALGLDREIELSAGDWIYLERGAPHALHGQADSVLLLTILFD